MTEALLSTESLTKDDFFTGSEPVVTREVVLTTGSVIVAREVLGIVAATGKAVAHDPAASDGSEIAVYISAYNMDATAADAEVQVYKAGSFNPAKLVWKAGTTDAQKLNAFQGSSITLQSPQA